MGPQMHTIEPHVNGEGRLSHTDATGDTRGAGGSEPSLPASLEELLAENQQLHQLLQQARERLNQEDKAAEKWQLQERQYERLLEEKCELIRQLQDQLEGHSGASAAIEGLRRAPRDEELIALQQELEREREQLKLDEDTLMAEMRNMEVQMSRERADLARQRTELQRLHSELKHELEVASRDAVLRERLAPLYRLHEEVIRRRPDTDSGSRPRAGSIPTAAPAPPAPAPGNSQSSGFLRRIFKR